MRRQHKERNYPPWEAANMTCRGIVQSQQFTNKNGYAKLLDDKYTFKTNVDNDKSDTTHTDMRNK